MTINKQLFFETVFSPGYPLCRVAWIRYLGVGKSRLGRCKRKFHGIDGRTINQGLLAANHIEILYEHILIPKK